MIATTTVKQVLSELHEAGMPTPDIDEIPYSAEVLERPEEVEDAVSRAAMREDPGLRYLRVVNTEGQSAGRLLPYWECAGDADAAWQARLIFEGELRAETAKRLLVKHALRLLPVVDPDEIRPIAPDTAKRLERNPELVCMRGLNENGDVIIDNVFPGHLLGGEVGRLYARRRAALSY